MRTTSIGIPGLISCALLSLTMSCGQRNEEAQPAAITHTLTDSLRQIISLDTIQEAPLHGELLLNGRVDFDQEKVAPVYSLFSGEVLQVNAELGDLVKKGEPLATIHSAEIVDLEKQRKETEQQLAVATRNLKAIESMTQAGLNSERDLLQARQQAADAQAEMERLRKLSVLYTTNNENHYLLKAPISGFITKREINPHMMVRPDQGEALSRSPASTKSGSWPMSMRATSARFTKACPFVLRPWPTPTRNSKALSIRSIKCSMRRARPCGSVSG